MRPAPLATGTLAGLILPVAAACVWAGWSHDPILVALVAACAIGLGLLGSVRLAATLARAAEAARNLAEGSSDTPVEVEGPREVQTLAAAINEAARAAARRADLLEQALDNAADQRDRFYSILDASSDGLLLYDAERRLVAVNHRCGELLGFSEDELLHRDISALKHSLELRCDAPASYLTRLERHFAHPLEPYQDHLTLVAPRRLVLRRYSAPVVNQRGLQGRVFTYTDVTAEADVDRLRSEFVSMASHELRTPLTSVHGALQLALSGSGGLLAAEDRELLEISLANTERLVRLVNDLLDLSKIEAGRMPIDLQPIDAPRLLDEAARSLQGLSATRNISVNVWHDGQAAGVLGDHDQLVRVITNLLGNALKYSPEGSTVTLSSWGNADGLAFAVEDQGPGIPADHVDRLFRPFSRVGVHERQTSGGTGLGLAISRAVVQQHGGRIWVERGSRSGSRFMFVLPRTRPTLQHPPESAVA